VTSLASHERAALADALEAVGADAPTLCAGWTARDLAAHLVAREHRPDSALGLVVAPLAGWTERVRRRTARRPYADLVAAVRTGPPRTSPFALPKVDAALNLTEHFVHCEDVRRAQEGWRPRTLVPGLERALWRVLSVRGRMFFRSSTVGVRLATPDGRRLDAVPGTTVVTLTGAPAELLLYAFGRGAHADVAVEGPDAAVARFRDLALSV
jgi:uncharacterized protein (TIGR03085 family)